MGWEPAETTVFRASCAAAEEEDGGVSPVAAVGEEEEFGEEFAGLGRLTFTTDLELLRSGSRSATAGLAPLLSTAMLMIIHNAHLFFPQNQWSLFLNNNVYVFYFIQPLSKSSAPDQKVT